MFGMKSGVIVDGELLTIFVESDSDDIILLGGIGAGLKRIPNTKYLASQSKMMSWEETFFTYAFAKKGEPSSKAETYYGPRAPKKPERVTVLKGKFVKTSIESKFLGEPRKLYVYLPPSGSKGAKTVYLADGDCHSYAEVLEPLMLSKRIQPLVLVGMASGTYKGAKDKYEFEKDFRAKEYLLIFDADRFELHAKFVEEEVIPFAEKEYGVAKGAASRAVHGYSNGGAFAYSITLIRPGLFAHAFPCSVAAIDPKELGTATPKNTTTKYIFSVGRLEPFFKNTDSASSAVKKLGAQTEVVLYNSGHDIEMWNLALRDCALRVFKLGT